MATRERVLARPGKPPGRGAGLCKFLAYSGRVDPRRNAVGKRIQRARRRAGFRSQKVFAEALGLHESSVANAERGDESVGARVFDLIEARLGWPEGCISEYIDTGDEAVLPSTDSDGHQPEGPPEPPSAIAAVLATLPPREQRELMAFLVLLDQYRTRQRELAEHVRRGEAERSQPERSES